MGPLTCKRGMGGLIMHAEYEGRVKFYKNTTYMFERHEKPGAVRLATDFFSGKLRGSNSCFISL